MKTSFFKSIFILSFLCGNIFAQGEAALPFLTLPLAPQNIGLGGAGTSMLNDNASAFLMNPAMIGYQAKENNIGINIYPSKTNMGSFPGINIFSGALNIGYNLEKHIGFPIGLGFGYSHGKINYNYYFNLTTPFANSIDNDSYNAFSFGVILDFGVEISMGMSLKKIYSVIGPSPVSSFYFDPVDVNTTANDYGLFINVPLSELIDLKSIIGKQDELKVWPIYNISFGYSILNVGDEIYYVDPVQSDPIPRTERLGYGIGLGLGSIIMNTEYELLGIDFTVDAENLLIETIASNHNDILIPPDVLITKSYKSLFSEINIFDNLIGIKSNENVVVHSGLMINLFETVSILKGHFSGRNYGLIKSNGFIVQSNGLFKLLSSYTDNSTLKFILDNFSIKYSSANYLLDQPGETRFNSFSFGYTGTLF